MSIRETKQESTWALVMLLVALTFVAYAPAWRAGFIWDDNDHLTANPAMTAPDGLRMIWSSLAVSRYYPLTLTSFWVQHQLWGLNPMPYHLVNITLHAINGVLLLFLLRRLRVPGAWFAAMMWALHPVNVESVAWITELKNTQSEFFFFLALLSFLRFEASGKRGWYAGALLCAAGAMLSKPSTVVLPVILLLYIWWKRERWQRGDIARVAPFFGLALGMSVLTVIEQREWILKAGTPEWKLGIGERVVIAGKAIWFYAAKLLWPVNLAFVYPRWMVDVGAFSSWLPLVALVAGTALLWICRRQPWSRAALFGLGFFVATLLPILGCFDVYYFRYSFVADHFQYLASAGLIALVASAGTRLCERLGRPGRHIGTVVGAATLMVLGALTWRQGHVYQDIETLWQNTLVKNPNCWLAHNNLGLGLIKEGKIQEGIWHCEQAVRIEPGYLEGHNNLALALSHAGMIQDAIREYEQALRIKPDSAEVHNNLGTVLLQVGNVQGAIWHYVQALQINPDYAEAHSNLGNTLMQAGRLQDAIGHYEQALRIKPNSAGWHNNLGLALSHVGRIQDAIGHYEQALQINPDYAEAHGNLGNALLRVGRLQDAIRQYGQAVRIKPDYVEAQNNLGFALSRVGRSQDAIGHYELAFQFKPDYAEAYNNLAWLLATIEPAQGGDPARAVTLAGRACELTGYQSPAYVDTLANAYAAAGRFEDAIAMAQKAVELARAAGQLPLVSEIEAHLNLFRQGHAYRQSVNMTNSPNP